MTEVHGMMEMMMTMPQPNNQWPITPEGLGGSEQERYQKSCLGEANLSAEGESWKKATQEEGSHRGEKHHTEVQGLRGVEGGRLLEQQEWWYHDTEKPKN